MTIDIQVVYPHSETIWLHRHAFPRRDCIHYAGRGERQALTDGRVPGYR